MRKEICEMTQETVLLTAHLEANFCHHDMKTSFFELSVLGFCSSKS